MSVLSPQKLIELDEAAHQIRRLSIEMITYAKWRHPGGSLSMADILAILYFHAIDTDPHNPKWEGRHRFILSKAHGSPALYATLALKGFYPQEEVYTYCSTGGLEGPTDMTRTTGFESSGEPLGECGFQEIRELLVTKI